MENTEHSRSRHNEQRVTRGKHVVIIVENEVKIETEI